MSTDVEQTQAVAPAKPKPTKKLKPARKQVKAGDVEKKETVQTGKEYSQSFRGVRVPFFLTVCNRHLVQQMGWGRPRGQLLKVSVAARSAVLGTNHVPAK